MTGRVHILRAGNCYRLVFVPSGPGRHLVEGEDALRTFLITDLEIPSGVAEMAIAELDRSRRYTIDILVTGTRNFWPLDTTPPPMAPEAKSTAPLPEPTKPKPRRAVARRMRAKPKPTKKAKPKGRSGR